MRSRAVLAAVIFLILPLCIPNPRRVNVIESAYASGVPSYSVVTILLPLNETYDSGPPMLRVTFPYGGLDYSLTYNIDGKSECAIPWTMENPIEYHLIHEATGIAVLPELSNGSHCINVTLIAKVTAANGNPPGAPFGPTGLGSSTYEATFADTVYFTVGAPPLPILPHATYQSGDTFTTVYIRNVTSPPKGTKPPIVRILSPANNSVIASSNVTLVFDLTPVASTNFHPDSFIAHYTTSWNSHNVSVAGDSSSMSIVLTDIPDGPQWITVHATALYSENKTGREYVTTPNTPDGFIICGKFLYIYSDVIGIEGFSSANFAIDTSGVEQSDGLPQPEAGVPTGSVIAAAILAAAIAAAGLMVYFKRSRLKAAQSGLSRNLDPWNRFESRNLYKNALIAQVALC